jgi:hypothetical protein
VPPTPVAAGWAGPRSTQHDQLPATASAELGAEWVAGIVQHAVQTMFRVDPRITPAVGEPGCGFEGAFGQQVDAQRAGPGVPAPTPRPAPYPSLGRVHRIGAERRLQATPHLLDLRCRQSAAHRPDRCAIPGWDRRAAVRRARWPGPGRDPEAARRPGRCRAAAARAARAHRPGRAGRARWPPRRPAAAPLGRPGSAAATWCVSRRRRSRRGAGGSVAPHDGPVPRSLSPVLVVHGLLVTPSRRAMSRHDQPCAGVVHLELLQDLHQLTHRHDRCQPCLRIAARRRVHEPPALLDVHAHAVKINIDLPRSSNLFDF